MTRSLVSQPNPSACSDEQHNVDVQGKIDTKQDNKTQNVGVNQYNITALTPAERQDDQTNNFDGALVLENASASVPTTGTEETCIANHQVTIPSVKPDWIEKNLPFDLESALPAQIDHPSIHASDTALPSDELFQPPRPPASEKEPATHAIQIGDGDSKENGFVTATSATKEHLLAVETLMDSDYLEIHEDGDLSTVVLVDKGKGVDPREYGSALNDPSSMIVLAGTTSTAGLNSIEFVGVPWNKGKNVDPKERGNGMAKYTEPGPSRIVDPREHGGALYDPNSMIVLAGTTSTGGPTVGGSNSIELVGVHRNKGKNINPEERGNGIVKYYEPGPSRIDFHSHGAMSFQEQGIPLESEPTNTTDPNDGLHYVPTLPRLSWHPKISPYRFMVFSIPLALGTVKAVLSQTGSVTTPVTLEWISGVVVSLVLFLLGSYETRRDIPKYLSWLFKRDCVDLVWYLAAKLSIQRPKYLSNECDDLEFDPGAFITLYRILVSVTVVFLGSLKTAFAYSGSFTGTTWLEWLLASFVLPLLYLVGLYENNSLGRGSSFFRKDRSHLLDLENDTPIPNIVSLTFCLVIYSAKVLPGVKWIPQNYFQHNSDQLPMGFHEDLHSLDEVQHFILIYIPSTVLFFLILCPLIFYLRVPTLASTSMLPSVIRYHTGRFIGAIERLSQRHPIDWIIYHIVAFGQLLLFVGWHIWIILFVFFVDAILKRRGEDFVSKILFYPAMVIMLLYVWIFGATGIFGEIRWWPSRDSLSHLVPPSIKNATVTKFIQRQVKALHRLGSHQENGFWP